MQENVENYTTLKLNETLFQKQAFLHLFISEYLFYKHLFM